MGERQQQANNLELRKSLLIKTGLFNVHRCMIIAHITHLHPPVHCVGTTSAHRAAFREELPSSIHLASGRLPNSGIVCLSPFSIICVHELQEFELWIIFSAQNVSLLDSQWGTRIYSNNYLLSESESMKRVQKSRNRFPRERERESGASGDCRRLLEDSWKQQIPSLH